MRSFWVALWFITASAARHDHERCSLSNRTDSVILVDCASLGLDKFPFGANFTELLEILSSEESDYDMEIDLSRNEISHAHFPSAFKSLSRIDLSYNKIASMKNVVINAAESVRELDLSHNVMLHKVSRDLWSNTLEVLTLRGCSIVELEEGFLEGMPWLTSLDVSNNSLMELNRFLPDRPTYSDPEPPIRFPDVGHIHLKHLNFSHNNIHKIHGKSFGDAKVKVLDVSNNAIDQFKFTMHFQYLEELYASDNNLRSFDGLVLPKVRIMDVSRNKLKDAYVDFTLRAPKLKILNLAHNALGQVPRIRSLSITDLDLRHCGISAIEPGAFSYVENLKRLNLMGNQLTVLSPEIFHGNGLDYLLLGGNPWKCDCHSQEFKDLYNFVLFERSYSDGDDIHCNGDTVTPWSEACGDENGNDDYYLSKRGIFYGLVYTFGALLVVFLIFVCYKCITSLQHSDAMTFDNRANWVDDNEVILPPNQTRPMEPRELRANMLPHEIPRLPTRRSTPPPNYEAALSLPVLTEEQRELALSTASLHRITE